jgi:hypothetical protein
VSHLATIFLLLYLSKLSYVDKLLQFTEIHIAGGQRATKPARSPWCVPVLSLSSLYLRHFHGKALPPPSPGAAWARWSFLARANAHP